MKRQLPSWYLLLAVILAVAFSCHRQWGARFSHRLHLAELDCGQAGQPQCLSCSSCHSDPAYRESGEPLATQTDAWKQRPGPQRPQVATCSPCHQQASEELLLRSQRPSNEPAPLAYQISFDHQRHLRMGGIKGQCVPCHSGAVVEQSSLFPPMERCFECHEHQAQWEQGQCGPCHQLDQVRALVPRSFVRHDRGFLRGHGNDARNHPALCTSCHTQQQCDDCHDLTQKSRVEDRHPEAFERQFTHPPGFLVHHAIEARSRPGRCLTCHTPPTCDGCHLERGVSASAAAALNPHPPGWAFGNPRSRNFHGQAARRDLLACVGCHDNGPATNCIDCHRVGGPGGNPHPRGSWTSRSPDEPMCRYCHER